MDSLACTAHKLVFEDTPFIVMFVLFVALLCKHLLVCNELDTLKTANKRMSLEKLAPQKPTTKSQPAQVQPPARAPSKQRQQNQKQQTQHQHQHKQPQAKQQQKQAKASANLAELGHNSSHNTKAPASAPSAAPKPAPKPVEVPAEPVRTPAPAPTLVQPRQPPAQLLMVQATGPPPPLPLRPPPGLQLVQPIVYQAPVTIIKCTPTSKCECCAKTDVFFTPDSRYACCTLYDKVMYNNTYLICKNSTCGYEHKLDELNSDGPNVQMMNFMTLNGAQTSVYICMYRITSFIYRKLLVHLHSKRQIKIKIITDNVVSDMEDFKHHKKILNELVSAGIEIRTPTRYEHGNAKMHNKWIIVDEQVLLSGSLNLTNATKYNYEFVERTTTSSRVAAYVEQFNNLWDRSGYQLFPEAS